MKKLSPEEFYRRRGDRTRRLAPNLRYEHKPLGLLASVANATSRHGQAMILTAANLFARWGRTLVLGVPDAPLIIHRDGAATLHERLKLEIGEANPHCTLEFTAPSDDCITLAVGNVPGSSTGTFAIGASGWDAVGWNPEMTHTPKDVDGSPVFLPAGLLAAVLGTAQVFKVAIEQPPQDLSDGFRWSLWMHEFSSTPHHRFARSADFPQTTDPLGDLLQVGVGAVGSNVLYFLSMLEEAFDLVLIDHDVVKIENLDRSLLFGMSDAHPTEMPKVKAATRILADMGNPRVQAFEGTWSEYVDDSLLERRADAWLGLANEDGAWQSMAENLPPLVLEGTTSDDWGFAVGRHIPFRDYCLRCRFPPTGEPVFTCSIGEIPDTSRETDHREVHAALPFLSAAAAALVVGELWKLRVPDYVNCPNYVEANLLGPLQNVLALSRSLGSTCSVCTRRSRALWSELNQGSHYSHLVGT